jgi:hypothetical protein
MHLLRHVTSLALTLALALPAAAQVGFLPELRAGITAIGASSSNLLDPNRLKNANVELLFSVPGLNAWSPLGELRPHLGTTVSFSGAENVIYGGLSWTFRAPVVPVFVEAGLGGGWQSGDTLPAGTPRQFGCAAVGRASASAGIEVLPRTALIGTLAHTTDFGLCGKTDTGRTDVTLGIGIRF